MVNLAFQNHSMMIVLEYEVGCYLRINVARVSVSLVECHHDGAKLICQEPYFIVLYLR